MQLSIARREAYDLLKRENLLQKGWTCDFDDSKKRLGCCRYKNKKISLSRYFIALNPDEDTLDTIRHEVAHALTPGAGHGEEWQREAERLGAKPEACATDIIAPEADYVGTCPNCGKVTSKHRDTQKIGRTACGICCKNFNSGNYDARYQYIWRNPHLGEILENGEWVKDADSLRRDVDPEIANAFAEEFGASTVIELKDIAKINEFRFDEYSYKDTPEGIFRAFLEVKMWREIKEFTVLRTFWRTIDVTGIVIDIWENQSTGEYESADHRLDLQKSKVGQWYELIMMPNPKGYLRLQSGKPSK